MFSYFIKCNPNTAIAPSYPNQLQLFKKCINTPIIDTSREGPKTLDSNDHCNDKFKDSVPKKSRCQALWEKCIATPIINSWYEGGGEEIDNQNYCTSEWRKCMS